MEIQSAFNTGLEGFKKASDDAASAAANIVAQTTYSANETELNEPEPVSTKKDFLSSDAPNINQSIVDLKVAEFQAKASAEVIQTADETLGTLLDVRV